MITGRRQFLKVGAFTVASILMPFSRRTARAHVGMPAGVLSPKIVAFKDPLKIPVALKPKVKGNTDYYTITMKESVAQFHSDISPTTIWGYNGTFPGPLIKARKGRKVVIRHINNLPTMGDMAGGTNATALTTSTPPTDHTGHMPGMDMGGGSVVVTVGDPSPSVHLHGAFVAPESDGHPKDFIPVGGFRDYTYSNKQRGTMLWFHDHAHGHTGDHVYKGLAGLYMLVDPLEALLKLPSGPYEVPLVIQDRVFRNNWSFRYTLDADSLMMGILGDVYLVNGVAFPHFAVDARKYRFRILNGSNSRLYGLALSTTPEGPAIEGALIHIGTDGGLMQRPLAKTNMDIWPAYRSDVIIDFSKFPLGSQVYLRNTYETLEMASIIRFDVTRKVSDNSKVPEFLSAWEELPEKDAVTTRVFNLNRLTINGVLTWTINGQAFAMGQEPLAKPKIGTIEKWRFVNPTNHPHPLHIHLVQFQVINIDGQPVEPSEYGWKDTMVVNPGGETTLIMKFDGFLGRYVFHCHNLEHEDFAMMAEFEVVA